MIKLLHGDDQVLSRKRLREIVEESKEKGEEVVFLQGTKVTFSQIKSALESQSLFGGEKVLILENFLGSGRGKEKEKILPFLLEGKFQNDLIIWEEKEIKGLFKGFDVETFKLPPLIFKFLDSLKPGENRESLRILDDLLKRAEGEMILSMLIRRLRLLLLASDQNEEGLSALLPWQKKKMMVQAKFFTKEELLRLYREILEIDFLQKTSQSALSPTFRLDLFLADL